MRYLISVLILIGNPPFSDILNSISSLRYICYWYCCIYVALNISSWPGNGRIKAIFFKANILIDFLSRSKCWISHNSHITYNYQLYVPLSKKWDWKSQVAMFLTVQEKSIYCLIFMQIM